MGICVTVTSGKGGTGKSTVSTGLAISFAALDKSVLLIDLDSRLGCLDLFFGIDMNILFDLGDIAAGREIQDAFYDVPEYENIKLIPAPKQDNALTADFFKEFIGQQRKNFDVVIIDMPAGVDFDLIKDLGENVLNITVSGADPISIRDARVVQDELAGEKQKPRLIINRFDSRLIKNKTYKNIDELIDISGIRLIGIVPISEELALLPVRHKLKRKGSAQKALSRIAKRILGEDTPLPNPKKI